MVRLFGFPSGRLELTTWADHRDDVMRTYADWSRYGNRLIAWDKLVKIPDHVQRYGACLDAIVKGQTFIAPKEAKQQLDAWARSVGVMPIIGNDGGLVASAKLIGEPAVVGPRKPNPALPVEVWHEREFDADKAMEAMRALCKGAGS